MHTRSVLRIARELLPAGPARRYSPHGAMCGLGIVHTEGFHCHCIDGDGGERLVDLDGQAGRMGHLPGGQLRPALDFVKAFDHPPEAGVVALELFIPGQREEEFAAGNAQLTIAAHGDGELGSSRRWLGKPWEVDSLSMR